MAYKKLYIIGNGFDIHHNIKSSYKNFYEWLKENHGDLYKELMDVFPEAKEKEWWGDFENNLGLLDLNPMIDDLAFVNQPTADDYERDKYIDPYAGALDVKCDFVGLLEKLKSTFADWIRSLSPADEKMKVPIVDISGDSCFITFNYTHTLEDTYHIPSNRILHIHGDADHNNFVLGHGSTEGDIRKNNTPQIPPYNDHMDPSEYTLLGAEDEIKQNTREEAVRQLAKIRKNVQEIICDNWNIIREFCNVDEVIILGLSFSPVDIPYLNRVAELVPKYAPWFISYFSCSDCGKIANFMSSCSRTNYYTMKM